MATAVIASATNHGIKPTQRTSASFILFRTIFSSVVLGSGNPTTDCKAILAEVQAQTRQQYYGSSLPENP
jgi:hypothetical protein